MTVDGCRGEGRCFCVGADCQIFWSEDSAMEGSGWEVASWFSVDDSDFENGQSGEAIGEERVRLEES